MLDRRAQLSGDKTALRIVDDEITFSGLASRSRAYANGLAELGVRAGDPVLVFMNNSLDGILAWLGCSRLGAVDIAINTAYAGDFLLRTLINAGGSVALCDEQYLDRLIAIGGEAGIKTVVVRGGDSTSLERIRNAGLEGRPWSALTDNDDSIVASFPAVDAYSPASVIYTSGTTGPSKGVTFSHNYLLSAAQQMGSLYGVTEQDVYYGSMPLFHLAAKACGVVVPLIYGCSTVLDSKFSVRNTWPRVRENNATVLHLLGSMMVMLAKLPEQPDDALLPIRAVFGAPIPAAQHHEFERRYDCRISTCYALSEACAITRAGVEDDFPLNSAGRINHELFEVRLVDEDDKDVAPGQIGEILVRPKARGVMFDGYWRNPEATVEAFRGLWFHTGDLGRVDQDGWFFYEGRRKDSLRRRGENVSAAELEAAVRGHAAINDVAAIGIPSEFMEDDIMIFVELVDGETLDHADLHAFCTEELPFFMVPRYIEIVSELPRNPVAKIEKYRLKATGTGPATWDTTTSSFVTAKDDAGV
jgi:crotonobetaine/carnitine-CoA ligase